MTKAPCAAALHSPRTVVPSGEAPNRGGDHAVVNSSSAQPPALPSSPLPALRTVASPEATALPSPRPSTGPVSGGNVSALSPQRVSTSTMPLPSCSRSALRGSGSRPVQEAAAGAPPPAVSTCVGGGGRGDGSAPQQTQPRAVAATATAAHPPPLPLPPPHAVGEDHPSSPPTSGDHYDDSYSNSTSSYTTTTSSSEDEPVRDGVPTPHQPPTLPHREKHRPREGGNALATLEQPEAGFDTSKTANSPNGPGYVPSPRRVLPQSALPTAAMATSSALQRVPSTASQRTRQWVDHVRMQRSFDSPGSLHDAQPLALTPSTAVSASDAKTGSTSMGSRTAASTGPAGRRREANTSFSPRSSYDASAAALSTTVPNAMETALPREAEAAVAQPMLSISPDVNAAARALALPNAGMRYDNVSMERAAIRRGLRGPSCDGAQPPPPLPLPQPPVPPHPQQSLAKPQQQTRPPLTPRAPPLTGASAATLTVPADGIPPPPPLPPPLSARRASRRVLSGSRLRRPTTPPAATEIALAVLPSLYNFYNDLCARNMSPSPTSVVEVAPAVTAQEEPKAATTTTTTVAEESPQLGGHANRATTVNVSSAASPDAPPATPREGAANTNTPAAATTPPSDVNEGESSRAARQTQLREMFAGMLHTLLQERPTHEVEAWMVQWIATYRTTNGANMPPRSAVEAMLPMASHFMEHGDVGLSTLLQTNSPTSPAGTLRTMTEASCETVLGSSRPQSITSSHTTPLEQETRLQGRGESTSALPVSAEPTASSAAAAAVAVAAAPPSPPHPSSTGPACRGLRNEADSSSTPAITGTDSGMSTNTPASHIATQSSSPSKAMAAAASGGRKPSQRSCSRSAFDALFYSGAMCEEDEEEDEEDTVVRNDAPNGVDGSAAPSKAEEDAFDDDNDCPYGFDDDFLCKSIGKSSPNDAAVTGSSATTTITTKLCPAPSFLSPLWQRKQSQQKPPQSGERSFRSTRNSHSFTARQSSMRRRKQQQQSKEAKGEEDDGMSTSVYGMDMLRGSSLRRSRSNRRGSSPHAAATTTAVSGGAATASAASTASAALTSRASASQQPQPPADPPTSPLSSPFRAALIAHSTNVAAAPVAAAAGGYEANEATTGGVFLADGAQETPYTRDWVVEVKATAGGGTTVPAHPTARSPSRLALPIDILTAVGVAKESERADGAAAASAAAGEADERQTAGNGAARGAPIEFVPWFPSSPLPPNGLSGSTGAPVPPPGAYMSPQRSSFFKRRRSMPRLMAGGNSNNNTNAAAAAAAAAVAGTAVGTNAAVDGTPGSLTPVLAYSLSSRMTSLFSMSSFCAIAE